MKRTPNESLHSNGFIRAFQLVLKGILKFFEVLTNPDKLSGLFKLKQIDSFYNKLLENELMMKILAFMGALALLFYAHSLAAGDIFQLNYSETFNNYPMTTLIDEHQIIVEGSIPNTIEVNFMGDRTQVEMAVNLGNLEVTVDLRQFPPGTHVVPVVTEGVNSRVEVRTNPSTFTVTIAEREEMTHTIEPLIVNRQVLTEDWILMEPVLSTDEVTIRGAGAMLQTIATVQGAIDANDILAGQTQFNVTLTAFDAQMNPLEVEIIPEQVTATIEVFTASKTIPFVHSVRGSAPPGMSISEVVFEPREIEIFGDPELLEEVTEYVVPLEISQLGANGEAVILLAPPEGAVYIRGNEVTARIIFAPTVTRTFRNVKVQALNLKEGLSIEDEEESLRVDVIIRGSSRLLDQLSSSDIVATVNLNGLEEGEHEAQVSLRSPEFISVEPSRSTIEITIID